LNTSLKIVNETTKRGSKKRKLAYQNLSKINLLTYLSSDARSIFSFVEICPSLTTLKRMKPAKTKVKIMKAAIETKTTMMTFMEKQMA